MIFLWVTLYGAVYIVAEKYMAAPFAMLSYTSVLLLWLSKTNRMKEIGVQRISFENIEWKNLIPLLMFPICNLLFLKEIQLNFSTILLMLSVAVVEEIFFRGFLLHYFVKSGQRTGIIVSAFLFAGFHFVNYFQITDFNYVALQMICALAAGLFYGVIVMKYDSLLPCIISHFLTNITGGTDLGDALGLQMGIGLAICSLLLILAAVPLFNKLN